MDELPDVLDGIQLGRPGGWEKQRDVVGVLERGRCVPCAAIERAGQSSRGLRISEASDPDMQITDGKVSADRAKVKVSFKFEA